MKNGHLDCGDELPRNSNSERANFVESVLQTKLTSSVMVGRNGADAIMFKFSRTFRANATTYLRELDMGVDFMTDWLA